MPSLKHRYDQWGKLTWDEQVYLMSHPEHVEKIENSRNTVFKETKRLYGRNGHNDESDAFRHCFWSAILARDIGYRNAKEFTTAHESRADNPKAEKEMDLHNNSVGIGIGRIGGKDKILSMKCRAAAGSGLLKIK